MHSGAPPHLPAPRACRTPENGTAAQSWLGGRSTHRLFEVGAQGRRSSPVCRRLADAPHGPANGASRSIPRPDGRPTWFVSAGAASRIGSRTDPSHCSPRRQIGEGEARDWPHLLARGDSLPARARLPFAARPRGPSTWRQNATLSYSPDKSSQVPVFLRVTTLRLDKLWTAKRAFRYDLPPPSTGCGNCVFPVVYTGARRVRTG